MHFNKETILDLDIEGLTRQEREYLVSKYFPETVPEWKEHLHKEWQKIQYQNLWDAYCGNIVLGDDGEPYRFTHEHLMRLGGINKPESIGNRVTDYSKWVMSLYLGAPRKSDLKRGKQVERSVARLAKPSMNTEWELIYRDPLDKKPTPLKISRLTVKDEPIWGAPDLVYKKKEKGEILIVERKASDKEIPSNGWPNLQAQLWAYSKIDEFADIERKILIGEVWGVVEGYLRRRKVLRWEQTDHVFNRENAELFLLYGGNVSA